MAIHIRIQHCFSSVFLVLASGPLQRPVGPFQLNFHLLTHTSSYTTAYAIHEIFNSYLALKDCCTELGRIQGRRLGSSPLNPTKVTLFTMILHNSENSNRDIRPFSIHCFVKAVL